MNQLSKYFILPTMLFLMISYSSTGLFNIKKTNHFPKQEVIEKNTQAKSPIVKIITKYETSPEDETGYIQSKEIFNEKGLRTKYIAYDIWGSGEVYGITTYEYNELDQLEKDDDSFITNSYTYYPDGKEKTSAWSRSDGQGATEEKFYNEKGDLKETKYYTASGDYDFSRVFEYEYNAEDKPILEKKWDKYRDGFADYLHYHISKEYDENGNVRIKSSHKSDGSIYSKEEYFYDAFGKLLKTMENEDEEVQSIKINKYNDDGELIEMTLFRRKGTLNSTYKEGDTFNIEYVTTEVVLESTSTFEYDQYGHRISMKYVDVNGYASGIRTVYEYYE